ncbi:MAG: hypothetical protein ACPIA7_00475 [Akkermansiaceae bacterium]
MQKLRSSKATAWIFHATVIAVLSISLASFLIAAPPVSASKSKLDQIDTLSSPTADRHAKRQQTIETTIEQRNRKADAEHEKMNSFLKRSDQEPHAMKSSATRTIQTPSPNTRREDPKKVNDGEEPATIKIECDGGIYFDNESGILTYLKNIRLNDSDSTFKLRCDDELKILFDSKPKNKKQKQTSQKTKTDQQKKTVQEKEDQPSKSFSGRGDLKEIIATGNVRITGKNRDDQTFLASGDTASYNAKAGEMILKGGRPTLQQSANEYLQAAEDDQWIRLIMKDKDIESIITSQGKWVMQAVPQK